MSRLLKLGNIADVYAGGTPSRNKPEYWQGTIPWVKTTHIQNCFINLDDIDETITEAGLKFSSARMAPKGCILMAMIGEGKTRGQVAILNTEAAINQNCVAIVLKTNFDRDYVWHQFLFRYQQIRKLSNSSGKGNLNAKIIREISLPFYDYEKQKYIGQLLNKWDVAIEKTKALIIAKENRFKWLISTLISNQTHCDNSHLIALDDIGEITSAGVDKKIIQGEKKVRLLNYLDVYRRDLIYSKELKHVVSSPQSKIDKCSIRKGDIFFTPSSETRGDIGHSAVAMEDIPDAVYSYHIVRLRPSINMDLLYCAYAFKGRDFYKQLIRFADGSGQRYVVSQNNFRNTKIILPDLSEQKRIANILYTAQNEIVLLKKIIEKYCQQKHGLMQKLLNGNFFIKNECKEAVA